MTIKAATLFSGIGAPEVAMPHWDWLWHAEIEPFPVAVMAARHPGSVNLGDVNAEDFVERAVAVGRPDVIVWGAPCQDFSVAGKRVGMDGDRGNMALIGLGIVAKLRPSWMVFENVPGLLSSFSGGSEAEGQVREGAVGGRADSFEDSDFAALLSAFRERGYLGCFRILDAQFAGVPQRRRRIFFVGHLGDWRPAAAVLLESESLRGDHSPRRETGQRVAPTVEVRANAGGAGWGTDFLAGGGLAAEPVARAVKAGDMGHRHDPSTDNYVVAGTIDASLGRSRGAGTPPGAVVAFGGNNTSGPIDAATAVRAKGGTGHGDFESETFVVADTLTSKYGSNTGHHSTPRDFPGIVPQFPLSGDSHRERFDLRETLYAGSAVRRLTPGECESLQGLPRGYTLIKFRGKPAADGPRYRALGNSMAVPVVSWILSRIEMFEGLR